MTRTFNTRLVVRILGAMLLIESLFMIIPTLAAWLYKETDILAFGFSTILTFIVGFIAMLIGRKAEKRVGEREGYMVVALVWIVFSLFGMLPYYLSGAMPTITDAFFETMSGFTTTGATILPDVEIMSHGVLLWRAITQWLGGMGIIVLSVALLPMFGLGGMQLYAAEVTGLNYEKLSPRIADTAKMLYGLYIALTILEAMLLYVFGMDGFDSICHSLSTIATGGFSTKNASLTAYTPALQYIVTIFMFLSGLSFALMIYVIKGKPYKLFKDEETKWYFHAVILCTIVITGGLLYMSRDFTWLGSESAFRRAIFTVVAAITSTGFAIDNYMAWVPMLWVMIFFLMFTGACAGSTSGGIKWVRIVIIVKNGFMELKRRIHPNAIIPIKYNDKPVTQQTTNNVMAFMIFYIITIVVTVLIFCACGINFDEAIGTTVSAIGNVGISIGSFGPTGTYTNFPTLAKWVMSFVMLIGRLEIFTVLLLVSPALWKK